MWKVAIIHMMWQVNAFEMSLMCCVITLFSYMYPSAKVQSWPLADIVLMHNVLLWELWAKGCEEIQLCKAETKCFHDTCWCSVLLSRLCSFPSPATIHQPSGRCTERSHICQCPSEVVTFSLHACWPFWRLKQTLGVSRENVPKDKMWPTSRAR